MIRKHWAAGLKNFSRFIQQISDIYLKNIQLKIREITSVSNKNDENNEKVLSDILVKACFAWRGNRRLQTKWYHYCLFYSHSVLHR